MNPIWVNNHQTTIETVRERHSNSVASETNLHHHHNSRVAATAPSSNMIRPPSPPSHLGEVPSRHRGRWVGQRCSGGAYTHSLIHQNIPGPAGRRIEELLMPGATCCFLMVIKVVFGKRERSGLPPTNSTLAADCRRTRSNQSRRGPDSMSTALP